MSGGQDPATWDYCVEDLEPKAKEKDQLRAIVVLYLSALDSLRMHEVYRLRKILREVVSNGETEQLHGSN